MKDYPISRRVMNTESPIMQVMKGLKRTENTIDLSQGIPFFGPPEEAIEQVMKGPDGINRYGPDAGDENLREAIIEKISRKNGMDGRDPENVMVTAGANIGFLNAISAICDPGDDAILLDPYYFNHGMTLDVLGVGHKHISMEGDASNVLDRITETISPGTRAIVIVSPNNPTGTVMQEKLIRKLLDLCIERGLWLISDETYEDFHYVDDHFSPASVSQEAPVISLFSLSKSYGISGWRQGYMVFPGMLFDSLLKVQDTTVICPSRIGQNLAYHCIKDHPDHTSKFIPALDRIRHEIIDWQRRNRDLVTSQDPEGAFYSFPHFKEFNELSSMDLAEMVLEEADVLLVPGRPFGIDDPPHLRMAYGNAEIGAVRIALERLNAFLSDH